jgi:hypothetical protein
MPNPWFVLTYGPDKDAIGPRLSYADVTERLLAEFGPLYGLKLVSDVVRGCRTGEFGLQTLIAPESLEELARVRLSHLPAVIPEPTP